MNSSKNNFFSDLRDLSLQGLLNLSPPHSADLSPRPQTPSTLSPVLAPTQPLSLPTLSFVPQPPPRPPLHPPPRSPRPPRPPPHPHHHLP